MIKHIVMWKLEESAEGKSNYENAQIIKNELEALKGVIPEIVEIEVGIDFLKSEQSYDVVLYSTFDSIDALNAYQNHPEHKKIGAFIGKVRTTRVVVDYEI